MRIRINCWQDGKWLPDVYGHKHNWVVETRDNHPNTGVWILDKNTSDLVQLTEKDYTRL